MEKLSIIKKLSSSLGRRDELPNQELAKKIAGSNDKVAVKELVENLHNTNKDIQNDCIKVLYEIAAIKPALVAGYAKQLVALLDSKNNRLQWGAMTALDAITTEVPKEIHDALAKIIDVADKGSVITNDHCVGILVKLCATTKYSDDAFPLLLERLMISPENQLPMYAENAAPVINDKNKAAFIKTLTARLREMEKATKRVRVEKVIKKLQSK